MKGIEKWHISIASVCVFLGILLAIQFQTQKSISEATPTRRIEELTAMLKKEEEYKRSLEKKAKRLDELLNSRQEKVAVGSDELREIKILSGVVKLQGEGLEVILDDSKRKPQPNEDGNLYIIHNEDILKVVNELWASGAEAVAVNNQRIRANTEITCAGPTISINRTRLVPPYVITALGDTNMLYTSLNLSGGIIDALNYFAKQYGLQVAVKKKETVTIPADMNDYYFYYAKPKKAGE